MIYEHRDYRPVAGRLEDLKERFSDHTLDLFAKHDIRLLGFWESLTGQMWHLHYLLEWESLAERERVWEAFAGSREWRAVREQTEADGPLVADLTLEFWRPVDFAPRPFGGGSVQP